MKRLSSCLLLTLLVSSIHVDSVFAADIPFSVRQAVVWVHCGARQGSGVVINAEKGYVLTNAHVLMDVERGNMKPDDCEVGFIEDQSYVPSVFYLADAEKYVFEESNNKDFAILKIGAPQQHKTLQGFPFLQTDEFSKVGDPISILSYPSIAKGQQLITTGKIDALTQGTVRTDATISPGSSGGAGVDADRNIIGIATGILVQELSAGGEKIVGYVLVDIRAVITWLDTFGINVHDQYVTHNDFARYHGPSAFIAAENLNCTLLAKTDTSTTVYCLKPDGTRAVFPNDATYQSWFADFSAVTTVAPEALAAYRLSSNVTMKYGSLIKIESDPKVYLVTDALGTLRWIPDETRARQLFGDGWAGFVKDVPVTFFSSYRVGEPI